MGAAPQRAREGRSRRRPGVAPFDAAARAAGAAVGLGNVRRIVRRCGIVGKRLARSPGVDKGDEKIPPAAGYRGDRRSMSREQDLKYSLK